MSENGKHKPPQAAQPEALAEAEVRPEAEGETASQKDRVQEQSTSYVTSLSKEEEARLLKVSHVFCYKSSKFCYTPDLNLEC